MNTPVQVAFRLSHSIKHRLETLAAETKCEQDVLVAEALGGYLDFREAQNRRTREAIDTVHSKPHLLIGEEEMDRWIDSLGTQDELPPPHVGK